MTTEWYDIWPGHQIQQLMKALVMSFQENLLKFTQNIRFSNEI